jgi:deoxyribodipyrimidine photo-lyase
VLFWFRRDLRITDNHGLWRALTFSEAKVLPVFIFDPDILKHFPDPSDKRITFLTFQLQRLLSELSVLNSGVYIDFVRPVSFFKKILQHYDLEAVHCNEDYEPTAIERDKIIKQFLYDNGIPFFQWKDQVVFHPEEILKNDKSPYKVFTPYSKIWKFTLESNLNCIKSFPSEKLKNKFYHFTNIKSVFNADDLGYKKMILNQHQKEYQWPALDSYHLFRDFPYKNANSKASLHLRFGTISIRKLVSIAKALPSDKFINELIWREFYFSILYFFPNTVNHSFKPEYDRVEWSNNETHFNDWCEGNTGYPFIDAGMRQLKHTGEMHNRLRMVCASFLVKNLLIDWRWGEAYFAQKLMDYDQSANVGGWQWAAGCGCDAAPYFRIFNPTVQLKKFDPELKYTLHWVPEFEFGTYRNPIVSFEKSRIQCLKVFKDAITQ